MSCGDRSASEVSLVLDSNLVRLRASLAHALSDIRSFTRSSPTIFIIHASSDLCLPNWGWREEGFSWRVAYPKLRPGRTCGIWFLPSPTRHDRDALSDFSVGRAAESRAFLPWKGQFNHPYLSRVLKLTRQMLAASGVCKEFLCTSHQRRVSRRAASRKPFRKWLHQGTTSQWTWCTVASWVLPVPSTEDES